MQQQQPQSKTNGGDMNSGGGGGGGPQQGSYTQQWVPQQQQYMAMMQYPAAAMAMMQQQMMMYQQHYMPYGGPPHYYQQQQQLQQHQNQKQQQQGGGGGGGFNNAKQHGSVSDEAKTVWVGDLLHWMDETYLHTCFSHTGQLALSFWAEQALFSLVLFSHRKLFTCKYNGGVSCFIDKFICCWKTELGSNVASYMDMVVVNVKVIRNKQTGQSEGYGFVEFYSRAAAEKVLQSYSGSIMPNTEQPFRLNWATFSAGDRRTEAGSDLSIFVGDLAPDVTDSMLQETFSSKYSSVKGAKVIIDSNSGRSKGYGFVRFGDENERSRAMTEMNGVYCSSRPMRIDVATPKKASGYQQQYSSQALVLAGGHASNGGRIQGSDGESNNATIFVGALDSDVSDEDLREPFSQFGEIVSVKIPTGKGCGFVQFANRNNAEDALQKLQGTVIGKQTVRLSWGRNPGNKQWRGDSGNHWNGAHYGAQAYAGNGYHLAPNQDPSMYAATAVPGAS
ncbi:hypothetical protein JRO89_XS02G0062000 [Xanthoceras sorbifolium]|uniref:RRM domain-containing protein n=1 Tax=Xanthoceras sorbifolium TaxID=99658 RepID=A0ABQ8IG52_9ROSI|nr:hypothetical protein JRO89_XS02G0062000 [Xanthoceras sorbifolium]